MLVVPFYASENYMLEDTASAVSGEAAPAAGSALPRRPSRWFASAGLAVTGAGPVAVGLQGDMTLAVVSAVPGVVLGLLFFFGVICPAIWSRKVRRQKAALEVMNSLLGRSTAGVQRQRR